MFFRKTEEKRAQDSAAQSEIDRLTSLGPDELAIEVLPTLTSEALKSKTTGARVQEVCKALVGSTFTVNPGVLLKPVREALQRLEHANLVMQMSSSVDSASRWRITTTGEQAITNGDTAAQLRPTTG